MVIAKPIINFRMQRKQKFWADVTTAIDGAGAKMTTPYYNCRWSTDKYRTFFTMEYPNIEAAIAAGSTLVRVGTALFGARIAA